MGDAGKFFRAAIPGEEFGNEDFRRDDTRPMSVGQPLEEYDGFRAFDLGSTPAPQPSLDDELDRDWARPAIPEGVDSYVRSGLRRFGWDFAAFYAPFHGYRSRWGIYYVEEPILAIARMLQAELFAEPRVRSDFSWVLWALMEAVLEHELTHFRSEFAATHIEVISGDLYVFERYLRDGWSPGRFPSGPALTEEPLATAFEIRKARALNRVFGAALADLTRGIPVYGNFGRFFETRLKTKEVAKAQCELLSSMIGRPAAVHDLMEAGRAYQRSVPRYWLSQRDPVWTFKEVLPRIVRLPLRKVIRHAEKRGARFGDGGRHRYIEYQNQKWQYSDWSDGRVPYPFVKRLAGIFGLSPGEYCEQVLKS